MQRTLLLFLICIGLQVHAQTPASTLKSSGYAPVNGLKMYYEIHGEGRPLLLIHGAYMSIRLNYGELIPILSKSHKVIAIEMQGHGRTADIDRPLSFPALADDIGKLLQYLKIDSADVLGYSLGATVALELAITHPAMVSRLVFISSVYKYEGWIQPARDIFPQITPEFLEQSPLKTEYDALAPDKGHWTAFVTKFLKFDQTPFDLGLDKVRGLHMPVLIIKGDNDGVELGHISEMYQAVGGGVFADMTGIPPSQLAIIPGTTHVTVMMQTDMLGQLITGFLDKR